jgi:hypothetical protein
MRHPLLEVIFVSLSLGVGMVSCSGWLARSEGLDPATLPEDLRADYAVFAERCSKCHSLARPLSSGIDDDDYWRMYVARMRRQPASGISQDDTVLILRFLHYYSEEQKAKKAKHEPVAASPSSNPATAASSPATVPVVTVEPAPGPTPPADAGTGGGG